MATSSHSPHANWRDWQVPPQGSAESYKIGWLNDCIEEGQAWYKSQRGITEDVRRALDTIAGRDTSRAIASEYRSRVAPNRLKRNMREVVGTLSKLRPMWGYHTDNEAYKSQAEMMNKVTRAVYLEQFFDLRIKDALKYAAATTRGWARPVYRRSMYGTGRGNIQLLTYGAPCVLPVQLPASGDFQEAYAVSILEEMPVAMAHGMFPRKQSVLLPSSSRYWYASDNVRTSSVGNIMQRIFGKTIRTADASPQSDLLVPIRYTYVIDLSINETKEPIVMGEPNSSWSYTVPPIDSDIFTGEDPKTGKRTYRKADANDARMYPYRRLLISTDQHELYDGPGFDWHGMLPAVSFSFDSWPWEPLGFSLAHDGFELNEAIKTIYRGCMDKVKQQLQPSIAYDNNAISRRDAAAIDIMQPNGRFGYDGNALPEGGLPFTTAVPDHLVKLEPEMLGFADKMEQQLDAQMAINDVASLAKARAVGSMDELEKIIEVVGPIVEEMSRSMEPPMRDLGTMIKYQVMQYYSTPRLMQYVGEDGISREVFDYDPSSVIPSHIPGESPTDANGNPRASAHAKIARARIFADNLRFFIMPNSLHEMTQMAMKLGLIQLKKAGVKIDSQTIAEAWTLPNYGKIPGSTVLERFANEQESDLVMAARLQAVAQSEGLIPPGMGAASPGGPGTTLPGKGQEGRPPSGGAAPALASKDGGARSTITESK